MSRSRMISIIVVLVLANYLVFSNLVLLLFTAGSEAVGHVAATRVPKPTFTPVPADTRAPTATLVLSPTPSAAPTLAQSPTPSVTATSAPPTASPTRAPSLIPTYAPVGTGTPLAYPFSYTVQQGDTLSGLADRFLVPRAKIIATNNLTNPDFLRVGQVLIIPDPKQ